MTLTWQLINDGNQRPKQQLSVLGRAKLAVLCDRSDILTWNLKSQSQKGAVQYINYFSPGLHSIYWIELKLKSILESLWQWMKVQQM